VRFTRRYRYRLRTTRYVGTKDSNSTGRIRRNRTDMWVAPLNVDRLRLARAEPANEGSNAMPPTDLNVPFHEKDDAKRLGARWDAVRKTWFLPDGTDTAPFAKWLPQQSEINVRCASYFIAQSVRACWHCDRDSHVFSFLLPRGHQTRQDSDESAEWELQEGLSLAIRRMSSRLSSGIGGRPGRDFKRQNSFQPARCQRTNPRVHASGDRPDRHPPRIIAEHRRHK
jgi:hypothetical protein